MVEAALDIEALSLSLGGREILQSISARIGAGEFCSVIGGNGAGKSTLLQCLMRIHTGWSGRVRLFGCDLATLSQRALARRIAYVPQGSGEDRLFSFTVREFVRMARYAWSGPFGAAHPGDGAAVEAAMARCGILGFARRAMDTLSGGERRKVYLAAALAQGADVLLLDEPMAFLDYRHQVEVTGILSALLREDRKTILCVTHDVNQALLAGGRVMALREGRLAWSGPAAALGSGDILERIFESSFRFFEDSVAGLRLVAPQRAENRR